MVYLAQTDTTAGFLSKDFRQINAKKNRPQNQSCLITTAILKELCCLVRVPNAFKNKIRKAKKTSFLYPNKKAIRLVKDHPHSSFLLSHGWMYSSSANLHKKAFCPHTARDLADIIIDEHLFEAAPSKLYKIGKKRLIKLR